MSGNKRSWVLATAGYLGIALFGVGCGGGEQALDQAYQLDHNDSDRDDQDDFGDQADWVMYNHDPGGSRWNRAETELNRRSVAGLHVLWSFPTPASVTGTPIVADNTIYAGDGSGRFYAFNRSGGVRWQRQEPAPITASAVVRGNLVIYGDQGGTIYGVDRQNGALHWQVRPNPHPTAAIYGSPTLVGEHIAIGIASNEEVVAGDPNYPCCNFRGSVVMLDPKDGSVQWQTFMISSSEFLNGSAGAAVWCSPTYDPESHTLYVTTGNNYTTRTTGKSDAIVALDSRNGQLRWANQRTPNDSWNIRFPFSLDHPDADFGDSPQVYKFHGRKVVGAGQKSGFYHVLDATSGATIHQIQVEPDGILGGLFADSAVADGVVYANGTNWPTGMDIPPVGGDLIAMAGDGSHELWRFSTPLSINVAGVAVAGGVVYFQSLLDGGLYALDSSSGTLLTRVAVGQGSSGPSVSRGRIYLGTGSFFSPPGTPGSIVALGR